MKAQHADPLNDSNFMASLSERNAALVRCSPEVERCAFWAVAHGVNAFELLEILEKLGLDIATWQQESWHTTPLAMLFEQYVVALRLTKLEQALGRVAVANLVPLLENNQPPNKLPTAAQLKAIAQLGTEYRRRCPGAGEASLDEMATAIADAVNF